MKPPSDHLLVAMAKYRLTVKAVVRASGLPLGVITAIISGRDIEITPEMALRLECATLVPATIWLQSYEATKDGP